MKREDFRDGKYRGIAGLDWVLLFTFCSLPQFVDEPDPPS